MDPPSADDTGEAGIVAGLLGEGLAARIDRWAADARVDEAARRRARERWLRQQAEEEGSLAGVLADVAERGVPVAVHVRGGRQHRGEIRALGSDFVALRSGDADVVVALAAVTSMRTRPGEVPTIGDRSIATSLRLVDVLAGLASERAAVLLVMAGDDTVAGALRSVGQDVVRLGVAGAAGVTAYVPVGAIVEVVVDG
ncbi:MAG: hypothetical protein ACRD07_13165 [Acidimicrobiales bacterium]